MELLAPFVWRRQVDPSIAGAMYELVHRARAELSPEPERDLKLGPGGIRESEFFVQTLQLVWGGQQPRVRTRRTVEAAWRLRDAGYLTEREAQQVVGAYLALRRAEHVVQWATGVQTHSLPRQPEQMRRLARTLGFADEHAFADDLQGHTETVGGLLRSLLPDGAAPPPRWDDVLKALDRADPEAFRVAFDEALRLSDDDDQAKLVRDVFELARHPDAPLGARSRERHRERTTCSASPHACASLLSTRACWPTTARRCAAW
jgi:glutamate-ammonia-ligase adenylyltransferase